MTTTWVNEFGIILSTDAALGWVTVGGHPDAKTGEKHVGGTPVQIGAGGAVKKGPPALKGQDLTNKPKTFLEAKADRQRDSTKQVGRTLTPAMVKMMQPDYTKITDQKLRKHIEDGVKGYYDGDFTDMNGMLRGTHSGESRMNSKESTAARLDGFKKAFDMLGHELQADTMVYRVVRNMPFDVTTPGTVFQDKGFVSTTSDKKYTEKSFVGGQRTVFHIKASKGMKVVAGYGGEDGAKEVTLPAGLKFKVVTSKKVGSGHVVQLEVVK